MKTKRALINKSENRYKKEEDAETPRIRQKSSFTGNVIANSD